jgi:hypothetical protein
MWYWRMTYNQLQALTRWVGPAEGLSAEQVLALIGTKVPAGERDYLCKAVQTAAEKASKVQRLSDFAPAVVSRPFVRRDQEDSPSIMTHRGVQPHVYPRNEYHRDY